MVTNDYFKCLGVSHYRSGIEMLKYRYDKYKLHQMKFMFIVTPKTLQIMQQYSNIQLEKF